MNQEPRPQSTQSPEPYPSDHIGIKDLFIAELADTAPTRRQRAGLLSAYQQHGTPFALYLGLDGVDPYSADVVTEFQNNYAGCYESRQKLMDQTLEDLGLKDELDAFTNTHLEMAGLLTWDWDVLWELLQDRWDIIDIHGVLYVFEP